LQGSTTVGSKTTTLLCFLQFKKNLLTDTLFTYGESISIEVVRTRTNRYMIGDSTNSVDTARSRTRIFTLVPDASSVHWTIRICQAFWSATLVRISVVFWQTFADGVTVFGAASSIGPTR
jgi:hypothetical protein